MTENEAIHRAPTGRARIPSPVTVLTVLVALTGVAAILLVARTLGSADGRHGGVLTGFLVAAAFAVAEVLVVHLHVRRNSHSFSMSELPLMVGSTTVPYS